MRIETELGAEPEIQAQMYDEIGRVYHNLGLYPDAERFYDRSHHTKVGVYGQGSVEVAGTLYCSALSIRTGVDTRMREANYRNALAIQRERLEPDAPELAATLHDLGWLRPPSTGLSKRKRPSRSPSPSDGKPSILRTQSSRPRFTRLPRPSTNRATSPRQPTSFASPWRSIARSRADRIPSRQQPSSTWRRCSSSKGSSRRPSRSSVRLSTCGGCSSRQATRDLGERVPTRSAPQRLESLRGGGSALRGGDRRVGQQPRPGSSVPGDGTTRAGGEPAGLGCLRARDPTTRGGGRRTTKGPRRRPSDRSIRIAPSGRSALRRREAWPRLPPAWRKPRHFREGSSASSIPTSSARWGASAASTRRLETWSGRATATRARSRSGPLLWARTTGTSSTRPTPWPRCRMSVASWRTPSACIVRP